MHTHRDTHADRLRHMQHARRHADMRSPADPLGNMKRGRHKGTHRPTWKET